MLTDWTGLCLGRSLMVSRVSVYFPGCKSFNGEIYLDGAEYSDKSGIISIRVGIRG